ncbi:helix-turn-helix domain-containing protein [Variovorax terrae]|uniref:Helix-turn-helix domain-containing protein n=1 Tax=Variovorax terrae TaxID=2923278 RepID=A0A9X1VX45_9BURK|nr:helix-turn-helix domain-containing protein [Variovorax terrae]MCJ0763547.1 helix-turn-helix domain-containing protein [Variovorax terrae]
MLHTRIPGPALRPFVQTLWATSPRAAAPGPAAAREHVLPTGSMHLVFRLSGPPLRLFDGSGGLRETTLGHAVVGGARATYYAKDVSEPVSSVGAQLRPGASRLLLGAPADALAGCHTPLDALWGPAAALALERLHDAGPPERQLALLEALLTARLSALPGPRGLHPAVAQALHGLGGGLGIQEAVRHSGYSHRRFIALFREATGLPPKLYGRVLRFQGVLHRLAQDPAAGWAGLALAAGYSDQAHFNRDFREFTGLVPQAYRRAAPEQANHVPVEVNSVQDRRPGPRLQ